MARCNSNPDPFGFNGAIQLDHLTPEQLEAVNAILNKPATTEKEA